MKKQLSGKNCCLYVVGSFAICILLIIITSSRDGGQNKNHNYLPNVQNIQNQYGYNYYEAYTFSYRYASVKASIAGDNYWMRFYAKHWDKYAHDKGHPNKLSQARFWQIMEHADREANK